MTTFPIYDPAATNPPPHNYALLAEDGVVYLAVVDEKGKPLPEGYLAFMNDKGLGLCEVVNPSFGFPPDGLGRLTLVGK